VAVSSIGEEEKPVKPVGSAAVALDVPAAGARASGLGEAAPLPAMARKPKPPPKKPAPASAPPVEDFPEEPDVEEPLIEEPPAPAPPAPPPPPPPPPPPEPPPVQFDDEG